MRRSPSPVIGAQAKAANAPGPLAQFADGQIPIRYHFGMTKQIAVRLPEDLVRFVDEIVEAGDQPSRAAVVAKALERERRRTVAARDAKVLAATGPDPDLAGLAEFAAGVGSPD